jgi:hypothetical protein
MDSLSDLFESINESSMDSEVKEFLKKAVVIELEDKPVSEIEKLVGEHLGGVQN